jgi:hypothetical protein
MRLSIRAVSLLFMLAILGMTIFHLGHWNGPEYPAPSAAGQDAPSGPEKTPQSTSKETARKDIPIDDAEARAFRMEREAVVDRTLSISPLETPAYLRVLRWVTSRSDADLAALKPKPVSFHDLMSRPEKHRGELIRLQLLVCKVLPYDIQDNKTKKTQRVYEIWGWPPPNQGWLYVVVAPELPPGFPVGNNVEATAAVDGFFFKLQGYQPADAKPNARPLAAPCIIGRIASVDNFSRPTTNYTAILATLIGGGLILAIIIWGWIYSSKRRKHSRPSNPLASEDQTTFSFDVPADTPPEDCGAAPP